MAPGIDPGPSAIAWDATAVGQTVPCSPVTIQRPVRRPCVTSLELTGPAAGDFQVDGTACQGGQLERDGTCTIELLFQPQQAGPAQRH